MQIRLAVNRPTLVQCLRAGLRVRESTAALKGETYTPPEINDNMKLISVVELPTQDGFVLVLDDMERVERQDDWEVLKVDAI